MNNPHDIQDLRQQIAEMRRRLLGNLSPEQMQLIKGHLDALETLRRFDPADHHDDIDDAGHHHHEHFAT
jgi:hypothetical protein